MITIKAYLYPNLVEVQLFDPAIFTTRNRVVYSRPIKVYKGIDNPLQLIIRNQDQKAVSIDGQIVIVEIQNPNAGTTVASLSADAGTETGTATVTIDRATMDNLTQRFYKLTIKVRDAFTSAESPMYIDDNYGVPLDLEVLDAYYSTTSGPTSDAGNGGDGFLDLGTL